MSKQTPDKKRRSRWPLTTLIEILPVIIALTIVFSYTTIKGVTTVRLVTPLSAVLSVVPLWVAILMSLITFVGVSGMIWLIYIFMRAPVAPDGSEADQ